jgi:hypothetical protein
LRGSKRQNQRFGRSSYMGKVAPDQSKNQQATSVVKCQISFDVTPQQTGGV